MMLEAHLLKVRLHLNTPLELQENYRRYYGGLSIAFSGRLRNPLSTLYETYHRLKIE